MSGNVAQPATVTSTSPLKIRTRGSSVDVSAKRLSGYTPTNGDLVAYVSFDGTVLVLGKPV